MINISRQSCALDGVSIVVDPGNGQILSSQKSSQKEIEEMHLKHSEAVVEDAGIGVGSFGLRALRH
ncbi:MAG: hypothetical protein ACRD8Z_28275 [Nitrososphaeraceae archaeon]